MLRTPLVVALVLPAGAAGLGAQVTLTHLGTVDVAVTSNAANPEYIGSNPSAVAWDGTNVWVAGYNNAPTAQPTAIVRVDNALTAPAFGVPFGAVPATPNGRGYSGLDVDAPAGRLAAAHDFGAAAPDGLAQWDLLGNPNWAKNGRGSSGVGFDPGLFGTTGDGTGWTTFGSGRRALQDNVTGADVYTAANGMILNAGSGTLWRDMDFDPFSGDVYLRKDNELVKCERTGPNAVTNNQVLDGGALAPLVNNQNVAFVRQATDQVVFWNDRSSGGAGQPFEFAIQCTRSDGTRLAIDFGGFTAPAGVGAYDFGYDDATGTLAISDFANRAVYVFAVSLFVEYGTGCVGQGNITPVLAAAGDSRAGGTIVYTAGNTAPNSVGGFVFGFQRDNTPLPFPGACPQHVTPVLFSAGLFFTGAGGAGSGSGSLGLAIGAGLTGIPLTCQAVILENASLATVVTTNGIETVLR
ncbi:MAG: hypothetical protein KDE27_28240 [Planctomycetes bacterium]|nr:hypothetical protein [Planctomycetota bacterium]